MASITAPQPEKIERLPVAPPVTRHRTVSLRVLVASLVVVAVALPSMYALRKWQLARTATAYLDRASELENEDEWLAAADYVSRFLALRPEDAQAEVRLAETFAKGADTIQRKNRAIAFYYAALGNDLADRERPLRQHLVTLLLQTGRFGEAEAQSRKILADGASQEATKSLALALFGRVDTGSFKSASQAELKALKLLATFDQARKAQPKDVELAAIQAAFLRNYPDLVKVEHPKWKQADREQNADLCLEELIAADPSNPVAYLTRFEYRQRFSLPDADADLAKALELAPKVAAVLATAGASELAAAQTLKANGGAQDEVLAHAAKAVAHIAALIAQEPKTASANHHLALGQAQLLLDKPDDAIATWKGGIKKFTGMELEFEARLADAYLDLGRLDDAQRSLAKIDERINAASARLSGKQLAALAAAQDFRLARLAFSRQDFSGAIPRLQRVADRSQSVSTTADHPLRALVMLGQAYSTMGQWREAAQAYDEVNQRNPRLPLVRLAAAQSWLTAGRAQLAAERAEQSLALRDSTEAWLTLTMAIYRQQIGLAPVARDWGRFDLAWKETEKRNQADPLPQPWQVGLVQFDALLARRDEEQAPGQNLTPQQVLRDLESRYPDEAQLWARLALLWQWIKMPAEADRCVAHLRSLPEGNLVATLTQVRLHRAREEYEQADELLASLVANSPAALRIGLVREWVNLKLARGDFGGAKALLVKEHELRPSDLATLLVLAELEIQSGRWDEAQKWEQRVAKLPHPADLHARVLAVRRLLARSKSPSDEAFAKVESELRTLRERAPSWAEVAALSGTVAQQREDFDEAATHYTRAVALGEKRLRVFQNLIAVLERLGRLTEAQEYLQRLESLIPLSQTLTVLQGAVELRLDQPERALAAARQGVEQRPQDVQARLWLARVLVLHEKLDEAETELKQAFEMAPQDMRVWSALALFYVRAKKSDSAVAMAEQIQKQQDLPEAQRYFVAAQAFELAGNRDLAEESFRRAAAADPKNTAIHFRMGAFYLRSDSQKAQDCLENTLKLDPQHHSARYMLALVLASRGDDEDWTRAESLLTDQAEDQSVSAGGDRLHAVLLISRGGAENLNRAQQLLEQLESNATLGVPQDRLLLAQVYERQAALLVNPIEKGKKLEQARRELEILASRSQTDWSHFIAVIEFFARRQQPADLNHWLVSFQQWMTKQPKPPADAILQLVRLQLKHEASTECGPWLDRLEAMKADPLLILHLRAQWYSQQKQTEQIRQIVDTRGEELLAQEETSEGKSRILGGIARIYRAVKELEDAERWERRLAAHDPKRYEGLAAVLTQQGKWREALELCHKAAENDKTARPALVALSCLSSTQISSERVADCEPLIQAALRNNKETVDLHYALGVVRVSQARRPDAIAQFRAVIKSNPRHVPALNNLALLLAEDDAMRPEALTLIDRAIDLAGLIPDLCDTKGAILLMDGQADQAIRLLEMATRGQKVDPRFEFHLAVAYDDQGNQEQVRLYFERAMEGRLEEQILTAWDQRMLEQLRASLYAEP